MEAAYQVIQLSKNVRFVMAGNGDMLRRLMERVAELRIASNFHFTGFLDGDEVRRLLSISDVYVMPSVSEPFGISALEAMRICTMHGAYASFEENIKGSLTAGKLVVDVRAPQFPRCGHPRCAGLRLHARAL